MKALLNIVPLIALVAISSCSKEKQNPIPDGLPSCIETRIERIMGEALQSPPMRVIEYEYSGQTVYYIPASNACCDQRSELWNRQCELLCHPDEGSPTDSNGGTCDDFHQIKTAGVVIWQDGRE